MGIQQFTCLLLFNKFKAIKWDRKFLAEIQYEFFPAIIKKGKLIILSIFHGVRYSNLKLITVNI